MKKYADRKCKPNYESLKIGDSVLVRNYIRGKLQPFYEPVPYKVIE